MKLKKVRYKRILVSIFKPLPGHLIIPLYHQLFQSSEDQTNHAASRRYRRTSGNGGRSERKRRQERKKDSK